MRGCFRLHPVLMALSRRTAHKLPIGFYFTHPILVRDGSMAGNDGIDLQIENEFYSFVRPKQTTLSGEKPTVALKRRGVQYVEIRALDVGLLDPCGVNASQLRFLEVFLLFCLLHDSPLIDPREQHSIDYNERTVALRGRQPDLQLQENAHWRSLAEWLHEIFEQVQPLCAILDGDDEALIVTDCALAR